MNTLTPERRLAVLSALVEGNSIRRTERRTGVHRDAIMRFLVEIGQRCQEILNSDMQGFQSRLLKVDELWTYYQEKK